MSLKELTSGRGRRSIESCGCAEEVERHMPLRPQQADSSDIPDGGCLSWIYAGVGVDFCEAVAIGRSVKHASFSLAL